MPPRIGIFLILAGFFSTHTGHAQQTISDVVIPSGSLRGGYGGWASCGADGQVYRQPSGSLRSIQRVSADGSTLTFTVPDGVSPSAIASTETGLNILAVGYSQSGGQHLSEMYRFDSQANLLAQHSLSLPLAPHHMAVTSSGKTIIVGHHPDDFNQKDDWKYGAAILDADDQLVMSVDLPLPPGGGGWTFASPVAGGDKVAYVILYSDEPPQTALATISEKGHIGIKIIDVPPDNDHRHHNQWVFGPNVAVEQYHYVGERLWIHFDEYDLASGAKLGSKIALGAGFQVGCYLGEKMTWLAQSVHVDATRHFDPHTLRLVTVKVQPSNGDERPALTEDENPHCPVTTSRPKSSCD